MRMQPMARPLSCPNKTEYSRLVMIENQHTPMASVPSMIVLLMQDSSAHKPTSILLMTRPWVGSGLGPLQCLDGSPESQGTSHQGCNDSAHKCGISSMQASLQECRAGASLTRPAMSRSLQNMQRICGRKFWQMRHLSFQALWCALQLKGYLQLKAACFLRYQYH